MKPLKGKVLGLIGGMGPEASEVFYNMLTRNTPAERDQDHINAIILSHADMPDRTAALKSGDTDEVIELLRNDAIFLEESGASCIAVSCNTAHAFYDDMQKAVSIPIINMIDEAAKAALGECGSGAKVGIMATDGTLGTGLYHKALEKYGLVPVEPSPESQKRVMHLIYGSIKAGRESNPDDFNMAADELKEAGCKCIVMGCTELSTYCQKESLPPYYLDAMLVAVKKAISLCK